MRGIGILISNDYDLVASNERASDGKLIGAKPGRTIHQNSAIILAHEPGQFKEDPTLGVGIENMVLDHDLLAWRRKIRLALEQDQQRVETVNINGNQLEINAKY